MGALKAAVATVQSAIAPEPDHAAAGWREHDLVIRKFHLAGLIPSEIAVVLNSQGLRVKTWAVNETFVRSRLKALELKPNMSATVYSKGANRYRTRPKASPPQTEPASLSFFDRSRTRL
jgi:hypothetical protein